MGRPDADIGGMIDEEMAKIGPQEKHDKPIDKEFTDEAPRNDVDAAFDNIVDKKVDEAAAAMKLADIGADYAGQVQKAFEKGGTGNLDALMKDYAAKAKEMGKSEAEAKSVLREQLKGFQDTYLELGRKETAAEIDAFSRSLESTDEVSTEAGKEFLTKLDAGDFTSIELAINALTEIKERSKGVAEDKLNAEFNALYAKVNERFLGGEAGARKDTLDADVNDDDIDSALGALG